MISRFVLRAAAFAFAMSIAASPAHAQAAADSDVPTLTQLFTRTLRDFAQVAAADNLEWLAAGGVAALATHAADRETSRILSESRALDAPLEAGALVGGTPFELGAAFTAYSLGRAIDNPRLARAGADLVQAQLIAESLTLAIKEATRRARPSGSGYSFPSGHATAAFASATVLQQHFGWKMGLPAYIVATYVGASRIHDQRHYLSDVAFGAVLGTIAGRAVTVNRRHRVTVGVTPADGGAAVVFGM